MDPKADQITKVLVEHRDARPEEVAQKLMPLVYQELHDVAERFLQKERKGHTLQPTALVHEAYLRLVDQNRVDWRGRTHFVAAGAAMMRRILIDHARTKRRSKRGGGWGRVALDEAAGPETKGEVELLDLIDAIEALAAVDPDQARVVELRFFGGLTVEEVADFLGVSKRKVEADWTHAKAWLAAKLSRDVNP